MPNEIKRTIKFVTEQKEIPNRSPVEGFPMRKWSIKIYLLNEKGEEVPANILDRVTYHLHPSFGDRAKQVVKTPPFGIEEEGWGEFEMQLELHYVGGAKGAPTLAHDLNFQQERYEDKHQLVFKNPKGELLAALEESKAGTGTGKENGVKKGEEKKKRGGKKEKNVDMEKLAEGLQKLGEEELLQVVQMVHEHKSADTYTKNDVESGEFHVDLYTLPDNLVKLLWDFTQQKVDL